MDEAGFSALLQVLQNIWCPDDPGPVWSTLAKLGATDEERISKLYREDTLAKHCIDMAIADCRHPSALLLIACLCRNGSKSVLEATSKECPALLCRLISLLTMSESTDTQVIAAVSILDSLVARSSSLSSKFANLLEGPTLEAITTTIIERILNPSRMVQASVHILSLRIFRCAIEVDGNLGKRLEATPLKGRLLPVLEAYTQYSPSEIIVDELLAFVTRWFENSSSKAAEEEDKHIRIIAKAFFDDFDCVFRTLVEAPRSLLSAATSILQRSVTSRRDAGSQEKTVALILRSRTLDLLYQGDWDWLNKDKAHILEVANLIEILLDAAPLRKDDIISIPLVQAIWPALEAEDPLILKVLADIVHETGCLDHVGLQTLIMSQNSSVEGAAKSDNHHHIPTILQIITAAGKSLQLDTEIDMDRVISCVAKWLTTFAENRSVIDAGLQLLLSLVDDSRKYLLS